MRFYDAKDENDLNRIERLLDQAGIEYAETPPHRGSTIFREISVAEEDVPYVEELLVESSLRR